MPPNKWNDWKENRRSAAEARERKKALHLDRRPRGTSSDTAPGPPVPPSPPKPPATPWTSVTAGTCPLKLQTRSSESTVAMHTWTKSLVNLLLRAAECGDTTLALLWPARLTSLTNLHALANVERIFQRDLRGMRTVLFPGTHASRTPLNAVLADKLQLSDFYQSLWERRDGVTSTNVNTDSACMLAALDAINALRRWHPDLPNPALAELVPSFVYDSAERGWTTTATNPLERSISKVDRLSVRRDLRAKVKEEWGEPNKAPGALMVLHRSTRKKLWQAAFRDPALQGRGRPDALLLDATRAACGFDPATLRQIPEVILAAREAGHTSAGAVIITDEPQFYFRLRAALHESKIAFVAREFAAEAEDDALLSPQPREEHWSPSLRTLSNYSVTIVDKDASDVAVSLQRLALSSVAVDSAPSNALLAVARFILRLSNLPAGFRDLSEPIGESDFEVRQNSWASVKLPLSEAIASGALNHVRAAVEKEIARAERLIDDWNDATPMALRLLRQVQKDALEAKHGISIVLPNQWYTAVADRFLRRKLGSNWSIVESRIDWHTLPAVSKTLAGNRSQRHFLFMGINSDVLRVLLTHPDVPHGSSVLAPYRQADSALTTLSKMKSVDTFKAYRGRIGLLTQELEKRARDIPNPIDFGRIRDAALSFTFSAGDSAAEARDSGYYRIDLEGGTRTYASGWVFRYCPDEDPPFRRNAVSGLEPGDFIFDMSDALRADIEASLELSDARGGSAVDPARVLLALYHKDVEERCKVLFKATSRAALAREIQVKMISLDTSARDCSPERITYWLALPSDDDTRPHAAKDARFFRLFCKALEMSDTDAERIWAFVRHARKASQAYGRELVARYSEILFAPESASVYRKVSEATIRRLQQEALHCVYRVDSVTAPSSTDSTT